MNVGSIVNIGILNSTPDLATWYDAYLVMTDGLSYGLWTGGSFVSSTTVPGWTYYGTERRPDIGDAWFVQFSDPIDSSPEPSIVHAWVQYLQYGCGDVTISLYDDRFELADTLIIRGPLLHLQYPNGGETFYPDQNCQITWTSAPDIENVKIEYSTNNGGSWAEVNPPNTGNTGSYNWLVPAIASSQCLVKVSDATNPATYDTSDATFTVMPSTITVIDPNGGEILNPNQNYQITWTSTPNIEDAKVEYSTNNGSSWAEVNPPNTGNTGSYDWLVPAIESSQCLVKVSDVNNPATYDTSDATFTVAAPPVITVISPNGGESIPAGGEYSIEWSASGDINDVFIEYSDDNGASWNTVVPSTENDGAYEWAPVADANSDQCLLRISDVVNPSTNDISDGVFTIYPCVRSIVGDLKEDCYVDLVDVAILLNHWLECANPFDGNCS